MKIGFATLFVLAALMLALAFTASVPAAPNNATSEAALSPANAQPNTTPAEQRHYKTE